MTIMDEKPHTVWSSCGYQFYDIEMIDAWSEKVEVELDKIEAVRAYREELNNTYGFATTHRGRQIIDRLTEILGDKK